MSEPAKRRPTIDDVAREAGVSRGTVSRVLNGGKWVSDVALQQVEKAIQSTGYRINPHARSLATRRAGSIAFLLTESYERFFADPNFAGLVRAASLALAVHDIPLVLLLAGTKEEQRRAAEFLKGGHVDGALLVSSHRGQRALVSDLLESEVPLIAAGIPLGFERKMGWVQADDVEGAHAMVDYLVGSGRERIVHLAGPQDTSGGTGRLRAYRERMGDAFDEAYVAQGDYSRASGSAAMREILQRGIEFDAVFAANDLMAAGAYDVLADAGIKVPEDVALAGFDDAPIAQSMKPSLTTMRQPFDRISQEMVRLLLDVIAGNPPSRVTMETELVIREST